MMYLSFIITEKKVMLMKQLLCFGDSNTWGLIPKSNSRYSQSVRWTGLLQQKLWRSGVHVREEGLCGRTTVFDDVDRQNLNGLRALTELLESADPLDAAVLMLGTNDCKPIYHADAKTIADGVARCTDELLSRLPAQRVLLISPIYLGDAVWQAEFDPEFDRRSVELSHQLFDEYKKIAEKRGVFLLNAAESVRPSAIDQEHFTEDGHRRLAEVVYQTLICRSII